MATDMSERKPTKSLPAAVPPPEPEHLPCPRCDSTNTKFCYYNNYNFSQPRHFCKSCRRYWTHGGTLRDIPVGGGSRKNAKRSRASPATVSPTTAPIFSFSHNDFRHFPAGASQFLVPYGSEHGGGLPFGGDGKMCGSFTSLLSNQGSGFLGLGGFGPMIDDLGFGLGRTAWPFTGVVEGGPMSGGSGYTWQMENGQGGFVGGGDCFTLPDLAISTPGTMLK